MKIGVVFSWIATAVISLPALGQEFSTRWDRTDPTNKAELRIYLATMYQASQNWQEWEDADLFWFTNTPPDSRLVMLAPALDVFTELYAHKLDPSGTYVAPYTILDLMRDDPAVDARFKRYTLTGEIETTSTDDAEMMMKHVQMAAEAIATSEEYSLEECMVSSGCFKTVELVKQPATTPPAPQPTIPTPIPVPPGLQQFDCDLRAWVARSLLACMKSKGLYKGENSRDPNRPNPRGRFDCDDFADAMAAWLEKYLKQLYPNMDVKGFGFMWKCPKLDSNDNPVLDPNGQPVYTDDGHAMVLVTIDGKFYLIDPYTGTVYGPYLTNADAYDAAIALASQTNSLCQGWKPGTGPFTWPPHERPGSIEPKPWWKWKDMQERFCNALRQCCNEIPTWYTPPTNCTPATLPDGSTPATPHDPCSKIGQYVPPGTFIDPNIQCR